MKRFISLLLIAAVPFVCLCANAQIIDMLGKWYWSGAVLEGKLIDPNLMGLSMVFDLKADGTVIRTANIGVGEEVDEKGTWVMDGNQLTITINNGPEVYTFSNGQFTGGSDASMIFSRELMDSKAYVPGAIVTKPRLKDFNGKWTIYMLDMDGAQIPGVMALEILGSHYDLANLSIQNDTAFFSDVNGENSGEIPCKLLDGELFLQTVDGNVTYIKCSLRLHKDGVISNVLLNNWRIYYNKVQIETE